MLELSNTKSERGRVHDSVRRCVVGKSLYEDRGKVLYLYKFGHLVIMPTTAKEVFADKCVVLFVVSCVLFGLISLVKLKGNECKEALEDQDVELGLLPTSNVYPRTTQECREINPG
ncbi:hypothetical protein RHGRI_021455 [Rhododendron griersonianum]|uniref:Uncharacterized protein n=1 Tax=Rhododendron griersonianum TaxID=479676 RepID=A0AAV6JM50_9ERIC|nr:hypothetical protein RHGRI_021455 [Rhododendron griersonianum]